MTRTDHAMQVVPDDQQIDGELVSPYDLRFDPDGRRWDLLDHKFIVRKYWRSLQDFVDDPDYDAKGIKMLKAWVHSKGKADYVAGETVAIGHQDWLEAGTDENDPRYIMVESCEVWIRPTKKILHIPTGAKFHLAEYDWPEDFAEANAGRGEYPLTLIALNKAPEDRLKRKGFYPIPTLRLIKTQLLSIQRLEYLYVESATTAIRKYLTIAGLLEEDEIAKLQDDTNRDVIPVNLAAIQKIMGAGADLSGVDLRRLFVPVMNPEEQAEMSRIEAAIYHQLQMIWQVIGQGPGDRGGLADAGSATEALNLATRLEKRIDTKVQQLGNIYDRVTKKFFLLLKGRQTLPVVVYSSATGPYAEEMWGEFHVSEIRDIDIAFEHRTGAQRPRTRAQDFQERNQIFSSAAALPSFANDSSMLTELFLWAIEPLEASTGFAEKVRSRQSARDIAKELALLQRAIQSGEADPMDPQVANKKSELTAALTDASLTDEDIANLVGESGHGPSIPKPHSAGQIAYNSSLPGEGSAAAGRTVAGVV